MIELVRPKIDKSNFNTIGRYYKFIKQFYDPNDWGHLKKHVYAWEQMNNNMVELNENKNSKHQLKGPVNYHYTYSRGKPFGTGKNRIIINSIDDIEELNIFSPGYTEYVEQWNNTGKITMHKKRRLCMETHLLASQYRQKQGFLFYTTSPKKDYNIICLDVDKIESDEAYYGAVQFLSSIFPNCYYERSTNGTGLHFYIIISFPPARYYFSEVNEGVYRNLLYYLLSEALRPIVNDNYAVKFDAVKGTNPLYDINNGCLKYGTLVKLPAPIHYEQFNVLYSSAVYSEDRILCVLNYFNDMTCEYSSGVYSISSLQSSLQTILQDTPIRSTPKEMLSEIHKRTISSSFITPSSLTTITNGGTNGLPEKKVRNKAKKRDYQRYTIIDIMNIGDSRVRESLYIKKYVGSYYSKHGIMPSEDEVERNYRSEMNYHKIGEFRKKRFHKYYDHTVQTFDPDKASDGATPYKVGMYDTVINQTNEQIAEWVNDNTSFKRKVYRYDIDITLEYIHICSKNKKNIARDRQIKKYAKQKGISVQESEMMMRNTTPRKGLEGFFKFVKDRYRTVVIDGKMKKINTCDPKKASALFDLVVELGLAECIDDTFDFGRARKFRLTEEVSQVRENWNVKNIDKNKMAG